MVSLEVARDAGVYWRYFVIGAVLLLAALSVISALIRRWKHQERLDPILICGGSWVLVVGFVLLSFGGCAERMHCGAWELKEGSRLRGIVQLKLDAVRKGEVQPTVLGVFASEDPDYFSDICSCVKPSNVRIGGQTMEDVERERASLQEMEREFAVMSAETPGWERLAYFVVCNDEATLKSNHADVIIGYMLPSSLRSHATFWIAYGDGHVECMAGGIDFDRLEESVAIARDLGLAVPPDDLVAKGKELEAQLRRAQ